MNDELVDVRTPLAVSATTRELAALLWTLDRREERSSATRNGAANAPSVAQLRRADVLARPACKIGGP